jgi:hypothetical protein
VSSLICVLSRSPRTKAGILAVPFYFQAAPIENFNYDTAVEFTDYDTLSRVRFSRPVGKQLTSYVFDTVFTNYLMADVPAALQVYVSSLLALGVEPGIQLEKIGGPHPFFAPPEVRVAQLRAIQDAMSPMVLTMADSSVLRAPPGGSLGAVGAGSNELSVEVTLRNVRQEERAGETDALYVQATFAEFNTVQMKTSKRGTVKGAETTGSYRAKLTIKTLTATQCTVARLAKLYYGDASKVKPIFARNSWLTAAGIERNENLRALATGTVRQTVRTARLKKVLAGHPQILIPNLPPSAAATSPPTQPSVGSH